MPTGQRAQAMDADQDGGVPADEGGGPPVGIGDPALGPWLGTLAAGARGLSRPVLVSDGADGRADPVSFTPHHHTAWNQAFDLVQNARFMSGLPFSFDASGGPPPHDGGTHDGEQVSVEQAWAQLMA